MVHFKDKNFNRTETEENFIKHFPGVVKAYRALRAESSSSIRLGYETYLELRNEELSLLYIDTNSQYTRFYYRTKLCKDFKKCNLHPEDIKLVVKKFSEKVATSDWDDRRDIPRVQLIVGHHD